ncbi:hypothetical protein GOHSU_44_00270 [Gordonia hirsuta DSM 44140 = NBRC 16056]|uniref:Carrier domain-containing protein n=1 Tax=Gordonia hirsuta DSM 44140 = NBRC 16056 TaxID=1121927 RepID=L7LEX9_9ACTN|nr:phosphopantetheine-binding protein [Gordonia hirsuta]GAC58627.1 hypothetical protein GOHSU_44_00270 [Gordonia hirsuta DSM 44140 = NBRC 16056]
MTAALDRARIVDDLAQVLDVPVADLRDDVNVLDMGLDSVRLMALIERWRAAGAHRADIVVLASDPTLGSWVRELTAH